MRNAYKIFVGKPEEKKNMLEAYLKETESEVVDWLQLDRIQSNGRLL
jgi:hypothetical protein